MTKYDVHILRLTVSLRTVGCETDAAAVTAEVGLNMISHLKQSMDQFASDADELYNLEHAAARPTLLAFDRFALSFILYSN